MSGAWCVVCTRSWVKVLTELGGLLGRLRLGLVFPVINPGKPRVTRGG